MNVVIFLPETKFRTCYILILYRLSIPIFPIIPFDLNAALAIVTERFFACICMLAGFFNLADSCATPINICVSQIALKKG